MGLTVIGGSKTTVRSQLLIYSRTDTENSVRYVIKADLRVETGE